MPHPRHHKPRIREANHRLSEEHYFGEVRVCFTGRVLDGRRVFIEDELVREAVSLLFESAMKHLCGVPVYTFMPDHFHVIVAGLREESRPLSAMKLFKQKMGFMFATRGMRGWLQKDFHDHIMRKHEDLGAHVRYLAMNPVRAGLASTWDAYPYTGSMGANLKDVIVDAM